jgi:hypothetical protein
MPFNLLVELRLQELRMINKQRLPDLLVGLAPALLFGIPLLSGRVLFWGIPSLQFIPWRWEAWQQMQQGIVPLWNSLNGMGAPLLANYQLALFYPPSWLTYLFAWVGGVNWMAWAHGLLVILHLFWAGLGMVRLTRRMGLGLLAQCIAGLAFSMGGYLVARAGFFSMIWTAAWMPWVILYTSGISAPIKMDVTQRGRAGWLPLALVTAMMLLAGHAQLSWYILIFATLWAGVGLIQQKTWMFALQGLVQFSGAVILAVLLASVQLIPTLEYLWQSQRSGAVDYQTLFSYSFWPWRFITLLAPDFFGNPGLGDYWGYANYWEDAIYIGLIPFLLAVSTLVRVFFKRRDRALTGFLWTMTAASFILALGQNLPIFPFLYRYIPTFDMFSAPSRYLIWAAFSLALLAGIGAEQWRSPRGRALYWGRLATAGALAVTLGALLAGRLLGDVSPTFLRASTVAGLFGLAFGLFSLFRPDQSDRRHVYWAAGVVAVVIIDLLQAGMWVNPTVAMDFYRNGSEVGAEQWQPDGHRLYMGVRDEYEIKYRRFLRFSDFRPIEDPLNLFRALLPNTNLLARVSSANNFDPIVPARYSLWMEEVDGLSDPGLSRVLELMNVRIATRIAGNSPSGFQQVNLQDPKRLRWFTCAEAVGSAEQALEQIKLWAEGTDLSQTAMLLVEPEKGAGSSGENCYEAEPVVLELTYDRTTELAMRVEVDEPGWLFMADTWYPGWRAYVDEIETPIHRANYLFRAIEVPAGTHQVLLRYHPVSFIIGILISGAGWLFVLISGIITPLFKRRKWGFNNITSLFPFRS